MNSHKVHNEFSGDGELPVNIPLPADAWNDMRKRLDDEMPVAGILLRGNIITAGTGFINSITALFTLLLAGSIVWWFSANEPGTLTKNQHPSANNTLPDKKADKAGPVNNTTTAGFDSGNNISGKPVTYYGRQSNHAKQVSSARKGIVINSKPAVQNAAANQPTTSGEPDHSNDSALNNTFGNTNKPALKTTVVTVPAPKQQGSSAPIDSTKDEEKTVEKITVCAGLQWKSQIPFSGTQNYFTGPNASQQPYRVLLPGIWVGVEGDKSFLTGEINPFASTVYKPKPVTATQQGDVKQLSKTFGVSAALRYDYNITGKWWAGGGVQAYWMSKGVGILKRDSAATLNSVALTDNDWAYLSKFQVRTDAEIFYHTAHWHAGLRAGVYFTPVAKFYSNLKNPLEAELFYRQVLWNNRRKK